MVQNWLQVWGNGKLWELDKDNHPHEAKLKLDISKAYQNLMWSPNGMQKKQ